MSAGEAAGAGRAAIAVVRPLFSDRTLIAFDKPPGLLTVPGRDQSIPSLWRLAEAQGREKLWAVHRLDRDTSGVVLFARTAAAHRALSLAFEHREVHKQYVARVAPGPAEPEGDLVHRLAPARRGFMRLAREGEAGLEAETRYRVLARRGGEALLELLPRTGRTHQLRLQLATVGSAIVGDRHYRTLRPAGPAAPMATAGEVATRLWLHARALVLCHPESREPVTLEAEPPAELQEAAWRSER